jgi:hypothetical protein
VVEGKASLAAESWVPWRVSGTADYSANSAVDWMVLVSVVELADGRAASKASSSAVLKVFSTVSLLVGLSVWKLVDLRASESAVLLETSLVDAKAGVLAVTLVGYLVDWMVY